MIGAGDYLGVGGNGSSSSDILTVSASVGIEHLNGNGLDNFVWTARHRLGNRDRSSGRKRHAFDGGWTNSLSTLNVEHVYTFDGVNTNPVSNDTLTLTTNVSGVEINLGQGTNTLNLAAGTNSISVGNVANINGTAGNSDTLNLVGSTQATIANVETINGSTGNDFHHAECKCECYDHNQRHGRGSDYAPGCGH